MLSNLHLCHCVALLATVAPAVSQASEVSGGAEWALQPIRKASLQRSESDTWSRNAIDVFVYDRLRAAGLTPSKPAAPAQLVRRLYLNLLGLPPSFEESQRFLADPSPDAYERLVDALLSKREYGERWGRHWLDVARYADTKGYVDAGERRYPFAFTYRDYVIRALNEDKAFDRFLLEQLAADRLDGAKAEDRAALGFLTVGHRFNLFPHEVIDDRIDVTTRALMGLTVTCARCHDHKFDRIGMRDYYSLYAIFANSHEPSPDAFPVISAAPDGGVFSEERFLDELEQKVSAYHQRRRELHQKISDEIRGWAKDYLVYLVETLPEHRTRAQPPLRTSRGVLREVSAYAKGAVIRWRQYVERCGPSHRVFGLWNRCVVSGRDGFAGRLRKELGALRRAGSIVAPLADAIEAARPQTMVELAAVYGGVLEGIEAECRAHREKQPSLDGPQFDDPERETLRAVLYGEGSPAVFSVDESEDLYSLGESTDVRGRLAAIERVFLAHPEAPPRAMVVADRPERVDTHVFLRGNPLDRGERVPPRLPALLERLQPGELREGSGRLELARAIVHPENPLTARVLVNRVWAWHFGQPLVATLGDFGRRSTPPTHPKLLDDLAARVIEDGWSLKRLHRWILTSRTWQQASDDRPEGRAVDPDNRLLWRMHRRRLGFEAMRDSLLAVSGRLQSSLGGQPDPRRPDDPESRLRSVYSLLDREKLPPVFRVFDFPSPDISSPGRSSTTVPQQALFLLNSRFVLRQAESVVEAVRAVEVGATKSVPLEAGSLRDRVRRLVRRVYAREPDAEEIAMAAEFLSERLTDAAREAREAPKPSPWRYGYGRFDVGTSQLASFTPLPHFDGKAWQGGPSYPDGELHYLQLTATGGHVGIDHDHAAVRRWISPVDGVIEVLGSLEHGRREACGEGVQAWIISSRAGLLGTWTVFDTRASTQLEPFEVEMGETLDFVVDRRANHSCDEFDWAPQIRALGDAAAAVGGSTGLPSWDAEADFAGPASVVAVDPWVEYAQVLLQSNEFLFVD